MKTVLISGAGVAGPSLAYWLIKYGFKVTIVEKAHSIRNGGYAVDFRGNAINILDKMGILDEVKRLQTHTGAVSFVSKNNIKLASMPSIFLSGELEILRSDLGEILYNLTKQSTEYIFDDSIINLQETGNGVEVKFKNQKSRTFDIVVGADGTHSKVRSLIFGDEDKYLRHLGYGLSVFSIENYLNLDHTGLFFATPGKLIGMYSTRDNEEAKVMLYFTMPKIFKYEHSIKYQKKFVDESFSGLGWQVPKLLSDMWTAKDFYFDTIDQIHMPKWSKGHTVLLGDACYCASPLSGAGTGLAIIGAYILAGELRQSNNVTIAFESYEHKMRPYVTKAQSIPKFLGGLMIPKSHLLINLRIELLRLIERLRLEGIILKLARQPSDSVNLKEY